MSLAEFHFIRPYWLLALLPAIVVVILLARSKLSRGLWSSVCDAELLPYLLQEKAVQTQRWGLVTGALTALLVIIALAGPTWQRLPSPVFRNASALVIALDLSRSMDAGDIKPSRLIRARYKIADILKQRKDGQTALLVYAGDAFVVTPLTDDIETIDSQLSALTTDIMPSQGSNTALALAKAVDLFKQAGLQKGRIMLITDGVDIDKTLSEVKSLENFELSILGVGTVEGAPIALPDGGFMKDEQGTIVVPKLNADELAVLAHEGRGSYQTITANDADVQRLLTGWLGNLAQQQGKAEANAFLEQWDDKGPWLLLLVLPLAALSFRKGLLGFVFLLLMPLPKNSYALEWRDLWQNKDQQAQQAYQQQQFSKAAEAFNNPAWKAAAYYKAGEYRKALESYNKLEGKQTGDEFYNQGNALAQSGQLEQALKAYDKALALKPDDADAKYNKELVEKELEKQKQQQEQQKNDKQQEQENSRQNQDKQDQQNKQDEQSENDKKPEQKPERPDVTNNAEQKPAEKQNSPENQEQQKQAEKKQAESEKAQQAKQDKEEAKDKKPEQSQELNSVRQSDEQQQANEQWLKRIPDDPAGLLKRKFKYQYGQREHPSDGNADAW